MSTQDLSTQLRSIATAYEMQHGCEALAEVLASKGFSTVEDVPAEQAAPVMAALMRADNTRARAFMRTRRTANRFASVAAQAWARFNSK